MPISAAEENLGEPTQEYTRVEWDKGSYFKEASIPEGTTRVVKYSYLSAYCYIFVGENGIVLGSYWFYT